VVYQATDACLAGMNDGDLQRELDLSELGFCSQLVSFAFNLLILRAYYHTGEIFCMKGL
jgi:hypothetical protein